MRECELREQGYKTAGGGRIERIVDTCYMSTAMIANIVQYDDVRFISVFH